MTLVDQPQTFPAIDKAELRPATSSKLNYGPTNAVPVTLADKQIRTTAVKELLL